jgi:hypothetical protein
MTVTVRNALFCGVANTDGVIVAALQSGMELEFQEEVCCTPPWHEYSRSQIIWFFACVAKRAILNSLLFVTTITYLSQFIIVTESLYKKAHQVACARERECQL